MSVTNRTAKRFRLLTAAFVGGLLVLSACSAGQSVTPTSSSSTPAATSSSSGSVGTSSAATGSGASSGPATSGPGSTVAPTTAAPVSDASLSIGFILEPSSLDFTQADGAAIPQVLLTNVYETLVKLDQSGTIMPSLAQKWTVSPDGKTYTFTLHSGVKFSDGAAFTADDAKFSIDRVTTAWKPVAYRAQMAEAASADIKNVVIASTTVVSPTVFKVVLAKPSNSWLFNLTGRAGAMFSRTGVADLANKPIGTGPYTFQTWNRGDSIVLARNDSYWGTKPSVKTVTFKYFSDPVAMNNALLTGGIQVVSTVQTPQALGQFKTGDKYQIIEGATDGEVQMTLNDGKAPLNDVRVRQAINYAIDKKAILQNAWAGYGTVIGSHESPNDPWFVDEADKYPHDVAKAKALLAAAGRSNLTLNLALPPVPYATAAAPIIISELAEAGITVKATNVTFPVWLDQVFSKADYDMTIINHVEPRDIGALWANPTYYTRYHNPAVAKLLADGDAGTPTEFIADYKKAVVLLADDAAAAWLWSFPNLIVADSNVKGLPKNAVGEAFVLAGLSVG
ncbi:peptide/nickel transport system substrate-binding protein [Nakamurella sp. UYEF19]|uniref:ABC transporter substrate-binding protein n=1 Tax=Nakamurella sp. UYEF19 TaxID=1756392 RepID=UPI003398EDDF